MPADQQKQDFNLGASLGFGAVVGVLLSAIVGMLQLSKSKHTESQIPAAKREKLAGAPAPKAAPPPEIQPAAPISTDTLEQTTRWSTGTKYFVTGLLLLGLLGILYISSSSLSTIIFAGLLTFIVHPVIKFFQRKFKMRRGGATLITYILVLALILVIPFLIIPGIVDAVQFVVNIDYLTLLENLSEWLTLQAQKIAAIPVAGTSLSSSLEELAQILMNIAQQNPEPAETIDISFTDIGGRISQTVSFLVGVFGPLISIGTTVVFTLLISLHMSLSVDMLRSGIKKLIPPAYEKEIVGLLRRVILIWQAFLRGQISLMVIMGVLVWVGNAILGTPQALLLGVLAGILEVIPSLGPILATIPAVILALFFGSQPPF